MDFPRIVRFGAVGFSGVFVNLGVSEALFRGILLGIDDPTLRLAIANAVGVVISIFTNFLLNEHWTWGDRKKGSRVDWWKRMGRYYVSASIAGVVQVGISSASFELVWQHLPMELAGVELHSTFSICTGIGAGMVINFLASHFWVFKDAE